MSYQSINYHINSLKLYIHHSVKNLHISNFSDQKLGFLFEYYSAIKLSEKYNTIFFPSSQLLNILSDEEIEQKCFTTHRKDIGIDLYNLEYDYIVQCKYYKNSTLTFKNLSTFLSQQVVVDDNDNPIFRNLMLCTNEDITIHKYMDKFHKRKIQHEKFKSDNFLRFLHSMKSYKHNISNQISDINLRDYQIDSLDKIRNSINKNFILNLPTGMGKTIICIKYIDGKLHDDISNKFLILVPTINLSYQWKREILKINSNIKVSIINCKEKFSNIDNPNVYICVYNSYEKICDKFFTKVIIDEAHNIFPSEIYKYMDDYEEFEEYNNESEISEQIDDSDEETESIDDDNTEFKDIETSIISPTDTKITYKRLIRNNFFTHNNFILLSATIDYEKFDNCDYYTYNLRDAIEKGYLNNYNVTFSYFSNTNISEDNCSTIVNKIVDENIINTIIYIDTIDNANLLRDKLNEKVDDNNFCRVISYKTSEDERNKIYSNFENSITKIIVNVNILSEGYDNPKINNVIFINSRKNKNFIIQSIGRSLRKYNGKLISNIYFFTQEEDEEDYFKFMSSIRKVDNKFCDKIDKRTNYVSFEKCDNSDDENIEFLYDKKYEDMNEFIERLNNKDYDFIKKLERVKEFIITNNKKPKQKSDIEIEKKLGLFLGRSIKYYRKCKNNIFDKENSWSNYPNRVNIFEEFLKKDIIKEHIIVDVYNEDIEFINNIKELETYIVSYNKRPKQKSDIEIEKKLGYFLSSSIRYYKMCKNNIFDKENIWSNYPNRVNIFEEFLKKDIIKEHIIVDVYNEDIEFINNIKELDTYIVSYNKRPNRASDIKIEKKLGYFLDDSIRYYKMCKNNIFDKKNSWSNYPNRVNIFEEFLEKDIIIDKVKVKL